MINFIDWFLIEYACENEKLLEIKLSFSNEMKTNYIGPFKNNLYVNGNHSGTHMWWQIIELIGLLNREIDSDANLFIHYPSFVEPPDIVTLIWKKEINLFKKYLSDIGYKSDVIEKFVNCAKKINTLYKSITPNYLFFTQDRLSDVYNSISRLKQRYNYLFKDNFLDFKKEIFYEDISFKEVRYNG